MEIERQQYLLYVDWKKYCESCILSGINRFEKIMGRKPDLVSPQRFSDKLEWLKYYDSTMLKTLCADKISVREYVFQKIGKNISIPILKIYDNFDQIDFSILPEKYVLKTNHGSHTNIIIKDKKIDKQKIKDKFDNWMSKDWSWWGYELFYKRINRKIFVEKFMENYPLDSLIDYKFLCFNGEPYFCQVISDRNKFSMHLNYYDMNWNSQIQMSRIDIRANYVIKHNPPKNFELMKNYCKILSKDFKFVRVDFYEIDNQVFFGELTFCPAAAYIKYTDDKIDYQIGEKLIL